jgi:hypothetical protein
MIFKNGTRRSVEARREDNVSRQTKAIKVIKPTITTLRCAERRNGCWSSFKVDNGREATPLYRVSPWSSAAQHRNNSSSSSNYSTSSCLQFSLCLSAPHEVVWEQSPTGRTGSSNITRWCATSRPSKPPLPAESGRDRIGPVRVFRGRCAQQSHPLVLRRLSPNTTILRPHRYHRLYETSFGLAR